MSGLPSPTEIAGAHLSIYESYYRLVDSKNEGQIGALEAAKFLKKSHLSDSILSQIWDIADPNSCGYLDKSGMFVALKLCALAQKGHALDMSNIFKDVPPPQIGKETYVLNFSSWPQTAGTSTSSDSWKVTSTERKKYEDLFKSLNPINGFIPGNKVKGVLIDSKLPLETLGKIWDLADMDNDGKLNLHEFTIAMYLVYKALERNTVPNNLPVELIESAKSNENNNNLKLQDISSENLNSFEPNKTLPTDSPEWVVSYEDQLAADKLFAQADEDADGFVSGTEIKGTFIQSGLPQLVLADIWNLCDIRCTGKLNNEQFALAMWLIKNKVNGCELPNRLSSKMIPPSFRKKNCENAVENNNVCITNFSNPELEMISRDISEIVEEKNLVEQDISQKEADIKIKTGKIKSLQSELSSLTETLKQLCNQKYDAQRSLDDLNKDVAKMRKKVSDQESKLQIEVNDLRSKRKRKEALRLIEHNLKSKQLECKGQVNELIDKLRNKQLKISQIKANMTQLEEQQHQIIEATAHCDTALAIGNASLVPKNILTFKTEIDIPTCTCQNLNNLARKTGTNREKDIFINNDLNNVNVLASKSTDQISKQNRNSIEATFPVVKENTEDPFGEGSFASLQSAPPSYSPCPELPPKKSRLPPPGPPPRPVPRRSGQGPVTTLKSPVSIRPYVSKPDVSVPIIEKPTVVSGTKDDLEFVDFAKFDSTPTSITDDFTAKCNVDETVELKEFIINNLSDFEEDPFANYRYDDLAMTSDPFSEYSEDFKNIKAKSKNKK